MKMIYPIGFFILFGCNYFSNDISTDEYENSKHYIAGKLMDHTANAIKGPVKNVQTAENKKTDTDIMPAADELIAYAKTLTGTPYKYASTNPAEGLDCSGFITHVFNHFKINVPRSSVEFTNYGVTVLQTDAKAGDLILFTGTDSASKVVGHMGIITENRNGEIHFIHSTSGKVYGVTISALDPYYKKRFVKITRIPFFNSTNEQLHQQ